MNIMFFLKHKNKANFLYRGFTLKYWKEFPRTVATLIRNGSLKKNLADNGLPLDTYDGSGQCTHPDVVSWNNELWLACTPYPYACAIYENPCVFRGKSVHELSPVPGADPLGKPTGTKNTDYCSDPAMIVYKNRLIVFWRDTWGNSDGTMTEQLSFRETADGHHWSEIQTAYRNIYSNNSQAQLSPAMLNMNDERVYRIYVRKKRKCGGDLELCSSADCKTWTEPADMEVVGLPEGYDLWHIGIASMDHGKSIGNLSDKLVALLLLRDTSDPDRYALYYAEGNLSDKVWQVKGKVAQEEMARNGVYPYKSAFLPDGKGVVYGAVDKMNRWYLCVADHAAQECFGGE